METKATSLRGGGHTIYIVCLIPREGASVQGGGLLFVCVCRAGSIQGGWLLTKEPSYREHMHPLIGDAEYLCPHFCIYFPPNLKKLQIHQISIFFIRNHTPFCNPFTSIPITGGCLAIAAENPAAPTQLFQPPGPASGGHVALAPQFLPSCRRVNTIALCFFF